MKKSKYILLFLVTFIMTAIATGFLKSDAAQGYTGADIGNVGHSGSVSLSGDQYTVSGSGWDIYGQSDDLSDKTILIKNVSPVESGNDDFKFTELPGRPTDSSVTVNIVPRETLDVYFKYGTESGVYTEQTAVQVIVCNNNLEPTGSGQHQWGSSYANWYNSEYGISFEQTIKLEQVAPNSFHTNTFGFPDASGGYIGLQTHGINNDGSIETNVRFSIWNTTEAEDGQCSSFGGEGVGKTCVINPLKLSLDTYYTIKVERLTVESNGTWWQGSVVNESTGEKHIIGKIKVLHDQNQRLIRPGGNFTEYFGPKAKDCQSVPQSIVSWQTPEVIEANGNIIVSKFRSFSKANPDQACSEAGVEASGQIIESNGKTLYRMINGSIPMCWGEDSTGESCTAPSINISNISSNNISLSWNDTNAGRYIVQYKVSGTSSYQTAASSLTTTSYTLSGLTANTTYNIRVYSVCSDGSQPYGEAYAATDETEVSCTAAETSVTGTSANSISLSWNDSGADSYSVYYKQGNGSWNNPASGLTVTSYVIDGLNENTAYDIAVVSVCADGSQEYNTITATTDETEISCEAPTINATATSANSISLSWNDSGADTYRVYYRQENGSWNNPASGLTVTSYVINGLNENTAYNIAVVSVCADGSQEYNTITAITDGSGGSGLTINDIPGQYVREPAANGWHTGTISLVGNSLQWTNQAGTSWALIPALEEEKLLTTEDCPYHTHSGGDAFILELNQNTDAEGFYFLGELYIRQ